MVEVTARKRFYMKVARKVPALGWGGRSIIWTFGTHREPTPYVRPDALTSYMNQIPTERLYLQCILTSSDLSRLSISASLAAPLWQRSRRVYLDGMNASQGYALPGFDEFDSFCGFVPLRNLHLRSWIAFLRVPVHSSPRYLSFSCDMML